MGQVVVVGLDIAKSVFQVHGVDRDGAVVVRRHLRRSRVLPFFATVEPCRIGIEACATEHYWARELRALGHDVRLMAPSYVKRYVKRQKNDAAERVPPLARGCLRLLVSQLQLVNAQALETDRQIQASARSTEVGRRLMEISGVGPVLASAIVAAVADPGAFQCGRHLAAWIGLVPRQNSSGGKDRLGGISKQGHRYLRQMLVVGALGVIRYAQRHGTRRPWLVQCWHGARPRSLRSRSPTRRRASSGRS